MNSMNNIKGFTLIELLITMAVLSIVTALIVNNLSSQSSDHAKQNQVVEMQQNVRAAMFVIVKEIMKAGYDPSDTGNYGLTSAGIGSSADPLIFTYDDGTGTAHTATINLYDSNIDVDTTEDEIQITAAGQAIAGNVAVLEFTYLDRDGNLLAAAGAPVLNINDIRAVHVRITVRPDERERTMGDRRTLEQTVKCRNLGI